MIRPHKLSGKRKRDDFKVRFVLSVILLGLLCFIYYLSLLING